MHSSAEPATPRGRPDEVRVPLRLAVAGGVLGIELYEPLTIGPLSVDEFAFSWPTLGFPVDLSGGVRAFRHRRGQLERLLLSAGLDELSRWAAGRLRDWVGAAGRPEAWRVTGGLGVGVVFERGGAVAFDLIWAPQSSAPRLVVANERVAGLEMVALQASLSVMDALIKNVGQRQGRLIDFAGAADGVARQLLPQFGVRAPDSRRITFTELVWQEERVGFPATLESVDMILSPVAMRALELARLTMSADDQLAAGRTNEAREQYVAALTRAPRHPDITRLIAEIDVVCGQRPEAALGMLVESQQATSCGAVGAALLHGVGDTLGAREAIAQAAQREPYGPLAAQLWLRAAEWEQDDFARLALLDRAVACAPGLNEPRWRRLAARRDVSEIPGAISDAEHLEALGAGRREKHETLLRAAKLLLDGGFVRDAGRLFERSLRYVPDDADATAGLARAILESGDSERAATLLERAVQLGDAQGAAPAEALIDLARILAEKAGDVPNAIARVREIPPDAPPAILAKKLEASWRGSLGDLVGASLAYAQMREMIERRQLRPPQVVTWLREAADFEEHERGDPAAAERHLALALRLAPHDRDTARRYRTVALALAARERGGEGDG